MYGFIFNKNRARLLCYLFLALSYISGFFLYEFRNVDFLFVVSLVCLLFSMTSAGIFWGVRFALEKKLTWL